jgi:transcriptional regulator with XRE-family HTH domain
MKEIEYLRKNLRTRRTKLGLSRKAFAKRAKLSVFTIVDIELRRIDNPKITTVVKLAKALGITIDELLKPAKK